MFQSFQWFQPFQSFRGDGVKGNLERLKLLERLEHSFDFNQRVYGYGALRLHNQWVDIQPFQSIAQA
jgi:hypothetical protein